MTAFDADRTHALRGAHLTGVLGLLKVLIPRRWGFCRIPALLDRPPQAHWWLIGDPNCAGAFQAGDQTSVERAGTVLNNIQALRAIAAILVVFVHLDWILTRLGSPIFGYGGVDLFFVISGFIMCYTVRRRPQTPWAFLQSRFYRVAPLYWFMTLIVFSVACVAPSLLGSTSSSLIDLVKSLTFVPFEKQNGLIHPTLYIGWTLNYEMFFYVLFAASLAFESYVRGVSSVLAVLAVLTLYGIFTAPQSVWQRFYTDPIILEFSLGMIVAEFSGRLPKQATLGTRGLVIAGIILLLTFIPAAQVLWPQAPRLLSQGIPAMGVVLGALALENWGVVVKSKIIIMLGNASYAIYLSHPFVTQFVAKLTAHASFGAFGWMMTGLLTLFGVVAIGLLTHSLLEKPLTKMARRLGERVLPKLSRKAIEPASR